MIRRPNRIGLLAFKFNAPLVVAVAVAVGTVAVAVENPSAPASQPQPKNDPNVGRSYKVPYRLTDTNHFLVRTRINGKGPFNFLVDTGAPALYISTETAAKIGLKAPEKAFWAPVERLDFEGGATLKDLKGRIEDPFQLVGMNALGLPGASIDGILGFTILGRFRMEIDPTSDRMTWTLLDFQPGDPPIPDPEDQDRAKAPNGFQAMKALGPLAKIAAAFVGKQPETTLVLRGFLGIELTKTADHDNENAANATLRREPDGVYVSKVVAGSPAEKAGVRAGDRLLRLGGFAIKNRDDARLAALEIVPDDRVRVQVQRQGESNPLVLSVVAGEGL